MCWTSPTAGTFIDMLGIPMAEQINAECTFLYNPFKLTTLQRLDGLSTRRLHIRVRLADLAEVNTRTVRLLNAHCSDAVWEPLDTASRIKLEKSHPNARISHKRLPVAISRATREGCVARHRVAARDLLGVFMESGAPDPLLGAAKDLKRNITIYGSKSASDNEFEFTGEHQDIITWISRLNELVVIQDLGVEGNSAAFAGEVAQLCGIPVRVHPIRKQMDWRSIVGGARK
jgi:hypothetical protein